MVALQIKTGNNQTKGSFQTGTCKENNLAVSPRNTQRHEYIHRIWLWQHVCFITKQQTTTRMQELPLQAVKLQGEEVNFLSIIKVKSQRWADEQWNTLSYDQAFPLNNILNCLPLILCFYIFTPHSFFFHFPWVFPSPEILLCQWDNLPSLTYISVDSRHVLWPSGQKLAVAVSCSRGTFMSPHPLYHPDLISTDTVIDPQPV